MNSDPSSSIRFYSQHTLRLPYSNLSCSVVLWSVCYLLAILKLKRMEISQSLCQLFCFLVSFHFLWFLGLLVSVCMRHESVLSFNTHNESLMNTNTISSNVLCIWTNIQKAYLRLQPRERTHIHVGILHMKYTNSGCNPLFHNS